MKLLLILSLLLVVPPLRADEEGSAAVASTYLAKEPAGFSLGVAFGALVVLGVVVGVIASNSSSSNN